MSGESDLRTLLRNMTPILHEEEYGFGYMPNGSYHDHFIVQWPRRHEAIAHIKALSA
jgi:hypothetical protein